MGNMVVCGIAGGRDGGRRRKAAAAATEVVDDRFTRPRQLMRLPSRVDYGRLRRLILAGKLAPCFDGADEDPLSSELEECPICFLYYPSLNRSVCCGKGICTECFIQVKPSDITGSIRCPFCNKCFYAVEHRGVRSEEEKGREIAEQKKVIETKLRMQLESQEKETASSKTETELDGELRNIEYGMESSLQEGTRLDDSANQNTCTISRSEEYSLGLEQIMLMEAMWESLQDVRLDESKDNLDHDLMKKPGPDEQIHGENVELLSSSELSCSSNRNI